LYRTSQACCADKFPLSASCKADSDATSRVNYSTPKNNNPKKYFPDLADSRNCVFGKTYDSWMLQEGFSAYYLFDNATKCCEMW
jgi:hypothetical protein